MTLTDRIHQLAEQNNMTFASIERELNFGRGTIRKWDINCPSADKLLKVANLLHTTVDYLLTGKDPKRFLRNLMNFILSRHEDQTIAINDFLEKMNLDHSTFQKMIIDIETNKLDYRIILENIIALFDDAIPQELDPEFEVNSLTEQETYLLNTFRELTPGQQYIILCKMSEMIENNMTNPNLTSSLLKSGIDGSKK